MKKALIGRKIGMTQFIHEDGTVMPVTVCELGPCVVVQKKNVDKDGYAALKLGFIDVKESRLTKPILSDLKKKGIRPLKVFGEVNVFDDSLDVGSVDKMLHLCRKYDCERYRDIKRKGFCRRCQTVWLRRRPRNPRFHIPPCARLDRRMRVPERSMAGPADAGKNGIPDRNGEKSEDCKSP